ncbi:Topoisomerase II-associated protein PAT1 [Microdochium nivale]|nr:Topoisomerase II-associated protein PAT1 [Microdochium nivale]
MAFHNTAAPGFGQVYDPFADLSGHNNMDDALEFDDTYDGLGDQLDETDDAFNDDTFGGVGGNDGPSTGRVGKDFDFFGQTAKVADAFEEEHLRYNLQQPVTRTAPPPQVSHHHYQTGYQYQQRPVRSGYEQYKEPEPELQVDASIWGVAPKKPMTSTPVPQSQPTPPAASRKMMSLEEVEAQMRSSSKATPPVQQPYGAFGLLDGQAAPHPGQYHHQQFDNLQAQGFQQPGHSPSLTHGQPVTLLQRPSSKQPPLTGPVVPSPLSQLQGQQPPLMAPTQILQNPNRAQIGGPAYPANRGQQSFSRQGQDPTQVAQLTDEDKAAFVEAEARRAKRNHKIFVLSKDNGLMTPQDKSFITRIQLQQLVAATGDPNDHGTDAALAEDFYYQVLSSLRAGQRQNPNQPLNNFAQTYLVQTGTRHGGMRRHGRGADNHVQRMEQQVQRAVEAAKNKPKNKQLVIEGSLGKISFSNAKTPKPLLNIKRADSSSDANRPSSAQRSHARISDGKATLKDVEGVYLTLMKMDDLSRAMPPPSPPGETPDQAFVDRQAEFQELNQRLWRELKVHESIGATSIHPFIAFISYQKGKKAIPRVFRHLTHEQRTTILTIIVFHLDQLDVVRGAQVQTGEPVTINAAMRENIEMFSMNVMPCLFQLLNESDLPIVTGVLGLITQHANIDLVARTRIGVSMFTMILSRAELIKDAGQANEQTWSQWVQQFNQFFNVLEYTLPNIFPGSVTSGEDVYVWQFLAAIGIGASQEEQQRLVTSVRDRVMGTITMAKTLPADMAKLRLDSVNLFMRSIGLDVELLNAD